MNEIKVNLNRVFNFSVNFQYRIILKGEKCGSNFFLFLYQKSFYFHAFLGSAHQLSFFLKFNIVKLNVPIIKPIKKKN